MSQPKSRKPRPALFSLPAEPGIDPKIATAQLYAFLTQYEDVLIDCLMLVYLIHYVLLLHVCIPIHIRVACQCVGYVYGNICACDMSVNYVIYVKIDKYVYIHEEG